MPSPAQLRWFMSCVVMLLSAPVAAQVSFEEPPIDYHKAPLSDPIFHLQKKLDAGRAELEFDKKHGYLPSLLEQLGVKVSSQVLVFSKTSFQLRKISPRTVYFSDEMYIGTVQGSDVLEISAVDPQQGAIFYALDQRKTLAPKFKRLTHQCIQCHASSMTEGVPGHMVRSVYTRPDGQPVYSAGTFRTDQSSPLHQRWGGWYVTGTHGRQHHMGNLLVRKQDDPEKLDLDPGANVTDLKSLVDTSPYLSRHSDIVALMVLEHQGKMHNLITKANFQARIARQNSDVMNKALSRPVGYESPITKRLYTSGGDRMLKYMLFCDEIKLEDSIIGSGAFTKEFAAQGPHDSKGRSLRDLDLKTRLMKYPCSYLIYGKGFDGLPKPVLRHVYRRLWEILTGKNTSDEFAHLSASDRQAILEGVFSLLSRKLACPTYTGCCGCGTRRPNSEGGCMSEVLRRYPSDLTDAQWEKIRWLIPRSPPIGDDRRTSMREVVNAVFYISRGGCSWRMLPKDFPPWQTVYGYFARWKRDETWQRIHDVLRREVRQRAGRQEEPSAGIVDSQSVKTTEKGGRADTMQARKSTVASGIFS